MMIRFCASAFLCLSVALVAGCGDNAGQVTPGVEQDELAKWVSENPAPPETEVGD